MLATKPKMGKSWMMLHADCELEDNMPRLQSRMTKLLGISQPWPKRLRFVCELPRLAEGGLAYSQGWAQEVKRPHLVVIDTFAMVRTPECDGHHEVSDFPDVICEPVHSAAASG